MWTVFHAADALKEHDVLELCDRWSDATADIDDAIISLMSCIELHPVNLLDHRLATVAVNQQCIFQARELADEWLQNALEDNRNFLGSGAKVILRQIVNRDHWTTYARPNGHIETLTNVALDVIARYVRRETEAGRAADKAGLEEYSMARVLGTERANKGVDKVIKQFARFDRPLAARFISRRLLCEPIRRRHRVWPGLLNERSAPTLSEEADHEIVVLSGIDDDYSDSDSYHELKEDRSVAGWRGGGCIIL